MARKISVVNGIRGFTVAFLVAAVFAGQGDTSEGVAIHLESSAFKVTGARIAKAEEAGQFFAVYVDRPGAPPILGSYRIQDGALTFEPRFPLEAGLRYRAVFRATKGPVTATFEIPKREATPSTTVECVYPSANRLPENQLKFYLHFSAPMSRGEAYRRIHLLEEAGREVPLPFLELDEELWDPEGRRLTIFFDPGRIKRGLVPHEEVGPPLKEGKKYRLVIDREWRDAENQPLKEGFTKSFQAGASDRDPPDPKTWVLLPPKAGTANPLTVEFPEPMDRGLLASLLDITDPRGSPVPGSIDVDRQETRWRFTPRAPWKSGSYFLTAGTTLEDLAGNTLNRPFEVDVFERVAERINRVTIQLPFTVAP